MDNSKPISAYQLLNLIAQTIIDNIDLRDGYMVGEIVQDENPDNPESVMACIKIDIRPGDVFPEGDEVAYLNTGEVE